MTEHTPRNFVGFGQHRPEPRWPDGAALALSLVLNYEEGAERTIESGDGETETYLHELAGIPPKAEGRDLNVESAYEYGSRAGVWRLLSLFEEYDVPVTIFAVGQALELNPALGSALAVAGHEIASHHYRWIDYSNVPEETEREHIRRASSVIETMTGTRPVGFYGGRVSQRSRALALEHGGLLYDSDAYDDDLPYWLEFPSGHHLIIPYTFDTNDVKYSTPNGFTTPADFASYLCDSFDELWREGMAGRPAMMSVGLHCRVSGRPARTTALRRFLDYALDHDGVWITRRDAIARHYHDTRVT